jgi:hypothetical protein
LYMSLERTPYAFVKVNSSTLTVADASKREGRGP